jgi:DNA replication ATP-dependent helicase Dna2
MILHSRMADRPENERDVVGSVKAPSNSLYTAAGFWERGIGIVTPHRAQQGLIIGILRRLFVPLGHNPALIRSAVDTVERFQGQQRDVILATFALGDPDAIADEDEFLLSLNRLNVMASRARAKLVTFVSQDVVNHLSGEPR